MDRRLQAFQDFLNVQSINIPLADVTLNILIAAILASVLSFLYVRYGTALSNRSVLAGNFVILAKT